MKRLNMLLISCLTGLSIFAQSTLTITVRGNNNYQIMVDGREYTISREINDENNRGSVTVTDLQPGQHTLKLISNNSNDNSDDNSSTFTIRSGYDVQIIVTNNGSLQIRETKWGAGNNPAMSKTPMTTVKFNTLYRNIRAQRSASSKSKAVNAAIQNSNNYFTVAQVKQLLQLVNSQNSRLEMAKNSYEKITDPENFTQLYSLFISKSQRDELTAYTIDYNKKNEENATGDDETPMTDVAFNTLYRNAQQQRSTTQTLSYINNIFSNNNNFFTTMQVKKLIELVFNQDDRLQLAKASYESVTDPENFTGIYSILNTQAGRNELAAYVAANNKNNAGSAMNASSFNTLYRNAQSQSTTNAKVNYISNAFLNMNNYFKVVQVNQLIKLVAGDYERLNLAKKSYRSIVDPENFSQLYPLLTNQASKNELIAYVNSYNGGTTENTKTAMTATQFDALYRDISNRYGVGAKMSALANVFSVATNYLTVAQAKQLIELVSEDNNRLQLAKSSYDNILDQENFIQMYDLLNSQSARNELAAYVNNNGNNSGSVKTAMSSSQFETLYRDVQNRWGVGAQMAALTDVFKTSTNYFTVAQTIQLIQLISDENNRLQLAKSSIDNITDQANFNMLYDLFNSQSNRNELAAYINNNNNGDVVTTKTAMSASEYDALYGDVRFRFGLGAKMQALTEIFARATYYFTVLQAKDLIQLVSDERNRLFLAKSSYDNITNPENFTQMYDILASQASKDELAVYVNANYPNR